MWTDLRVKKDDYEEEAEFNKLNDWKIYVYNLIKQMHATLT